MRGARFTLLVIVVCGMPAASAQAAFPGVNGRIAFDRQVGNGNTQIFSVAPDGSAPVDLSNNPSLDSCTPSYSRDGRLIAFGQAGGCNGTGGGVMVMNADGSNPHQVTTPPAGSHDGQPRFSPDGKRIVFERSDSGTGELLFVVGVDGAGLHQVLVPPDGMADETPRWSPDGTKIAFMREPLDDSGGQIMLVGADGTGPVTPVSSPPQFYKDGDPSFSPDGSKVAFGRSQAVELGVATNIVVVDLATHVETPLTTDSAPTLENADPSFSPDGKLIAFQHYDENFNSGEIVVMKADGSNAHPITPAVPNQVDASPDWQSPQQALAVAKTGTGSGTVTSTPAGITCGSACSAEFTAGLPVNLTATPASGSTFVGWSGAGCAGTASCTVTLSSDQAVTATFAAIPAPTPALSAFNVTPRNTSIAGRRVHGKCVKPSKQNRHSVRCARSMLLTVAYDLNIPSNVTFQLTRALPGRNVNGKCVKPTKRNAKRQRCALTTRVPGVVGPGAAGANRHTLDAKALGPGSYRLTATPVAGARTGAAQSTSFTIVS